MYQSHQGLAFIGEAGYGAVIKNVILRDACVIESNASLGEDGEDDDRFGLLVGCSSYSSGTISVENCIVEGVIGSAAARARGDVEPPEGHTMSSYPPSYEYGAGIMGEVGIKNGTIVVTISNCVVLARNYSSDSDSALITNKNRVTPTITNCTAYNAASQLAEGKAAIDAAVAAARQ